VPEWHLVTHVRKTIAADRWGGKKKGAAEKPVDEKKRASMPSLIPCPGLVGALWRCDIGRSLAYALGILRWSVHHMKGIFLAPMLEESQN